MGVETLPSKNTGTETNQGLSPTSSVTFDLTNPLRFDDFDSPFAVPVAENLPTKNAGSETNQTKN